MSTENVRHINIIGHQNPDTDSICSALSYAWLKNHGSLTGKYEARRAGLRQPYRQVRSPPGRARQPRNPVCAQAFRH